MSLWDVMVSIFWFMMLVAWFWLLIGIITDIFRDDDLSGGAKAAWCLFVIVLPWLGVLTYLLVRGRSMGERARRQAEQNDKAFRQYVRSAAETQPPAPSMADELSKLAELRDRGAISAQDFESAKSRLLGQATPTRVPADERPPQRTVNPV